MVPAVQGREPCAHSRLGALPHERRGVIGIVYNDSTDKAREYVRTNGVTWPTVQDGDGRIAFAYGVHGPPETYFIGRDGIIAGRHIGEITELTLINAIDALRAQAAR